jgi:hypothetical protein
MKKTKKLTKVQAVDTTGSIWDKDRIQALIEINDDAVYRAMLRIYEKQTADEQQYATTHIYNSVGFTGTDAEIMTSFTNAYQKYGRLTTKQMAIARKKMKKYWKQLLEVIREANPNQPERVAK